MLSTYTKVKLLQPDNPSHIADCDAYTCYTFINNLLTKDQEISVKDLLNCSWFTFKFFDKTLPLLEEQGLVKLH